jgi:hypothetical protein
LIRDDRESTIISTNYKKGIHLIQIIAIGFIAIFFLLFLSSINKLSRKSLIILISISILFSALFSFIEHKNSIYKDRIYNLSLAFEQDKNITCGEFIINREGFNMTSNSFLAKKDSQNRGLIVPFKDCFEK